VFGSVPSFGLAQRDKIGPCTCLLTGSMMYEVNVRLSDKQPYLPHQMTSSSSFVNIPQTAFAP
jgi:hypothetical protein